MGGYIGSKAVTLSTTAADVAGNAVIDGDLTVKGTTVTIDSSQAQEIRLGDNDKMTFGDATGGDLQIYHDGNHSYIKDAGTGDLILQGSDQVKIQTTTGETMVSTNENNAVVLYYDNNSKLATTSTGIDVTGTVTADGLTVDGSGSIRHTDATTNISLTPTSTGGVVNVRDSSGNSQISLDARTTQVGIGTSSPSRQLSLYGTLPAIAFQTSTSGTTTGDGFQIQANSTDVFLWNYENTPVRFATNNAERMRIDSSGNVGIGTSSPSALLDIDAGSATGTHLEITTTGSGHNFDMVDSSSTARFRNVDGILRIGADNGNEAADSAIIFQVDGTEAMRINSSSKVNFAKTDAIEIGRNEAASTYDSGERLIYLYAGSSGDETAIAARNVADGSPAFRCQVGGTTRAEIEANGDFLSATNSYGSTSDQTLKENIVASGSQWDDLKAVQVKKFSYIADELDEANMIGVIAQDLEASGMSGLVSSMDHGDGTMVKTVKYSVLYMKAIKALQEAMNRIETLETEMTSVKARLDALEAN